MTVLILLPRIYQYLNLNNFAEVFTILLQKIHYFGQFKDNNSVEKHKKPDKSLHFFICFSSSICLQHCLYLFVFESKFIFMWSPLQWILIQKILEFLKKKVAIWMIHNTLLDRHAEDTKNSYCLFSVQKSNFGTFGTFS